SRKRNLAAAVHRLMIVVLLNAARQIWISIPDWELQLRPFVVGKKKPFTWLPVPSSIPIVDDPAGVAQVRARFAAKGTRLIGHFGAYNSYLTDLMTALLPSLMNGESDLSILLLGYGSDELRNCLVKAHPRSADRIYSTGELPVAEVSKHISACD